jgi:hypothetical protein
MSITNRPISTGYYYLILNYQENVAAKHLFRHSSIKLLTSEGVQEMSDLSISFDPTFQTLIFHSIKVIRNGKPIDKLMYKDIRVVQREENMDRYLYDGRLTAIVNLTDIRVGDIIDYSYSLRGENPIFGGTYDKKIYLQYSVPIEHFIYRLIIPNNRNIRFKYKNGATPPERIVDNNVTVYSWKKQKLEPIIFDINTPGWYDPCPSISVSEYDSWERIVKQYAPMYSASPQTREVLKKRLKNIIKGTTEDTIISQSIRFVQDHIRYLGFEDGFNSHKPTAPLKLLAQRFGDCKAKAFLLCEILKSHKIEAYPLLVNTYDGYSITNDLPTPNAFNHCTVRLLHNNRIYYVDPTISYQGGDLEHLYFPNYRYGLLLKNGVASVDSIPFNNYYHINACEKFDLDKVGGSADLVVSTKYAGGAADRIRNDFSGMSGESLEKQYVDFYSKLYPNIRAVKKIEVTDLRDNLNELLVEEYYRIDSMWQKTDSSKNTLSADFYPLSIETFFSNKKSPSRTMPYAVSYPVDYELRTIVNLPEKWTIHNDSACIRTASFLYTYARQYQNNCVNIVYRYTTFQDHIAATQADDFILKHNGIMEKLPFTLTYTPNTMATSSTFKFSWAAGLIALIMLSISTYVAVKLYRHFDLETANPDAEPQMLGGWLILIGIGLLFTPLRLLYEMYHTPNFFNSVIWSPLFDFNNSSKNMLIGIVMFFELIYNSGKLVFVVLLILLFFKRRTTFPVFAIALYITSVVVLIGDTWVVAQLHISESTAIDTNKSYKDIAQCIISVAIWVPYLLRSQRVKQTFVMRAPKKAQRIGDTINTKSL